MFLTPYNPHYYLNLNLKLHFGQLFKKSSIAQIFNCLCNVASTIHVPILYYLSIVILQLIPLIVIFLKPFFELAIFISRDSSFSCSWLPSYLFICLLPRPQCFHYEEHEFPPPSPSLIFARGQNDPVPLKGSLQSATRLSPVCIM